MEKKVFVFDFDLTLTTLHSMGWPELNIDYFYGDLPKVREMLFRLKERNIPVYILTQGSESQVKTYLETMLYPEASVLIKKIYGAVDVAYQNPITPQKHQQLIDLPLPYFQRFQLEIPEEEKQKYKEDKDIDRDSLMWAYGKMFMLEEIAQKEKVSQDQIYFFDDKKINIILARAYGFKNSFYIQMATLLQTLEVVDELLRIFPLLPFQRRMKRWKLHYDRKLDQDVQKQRLTPQQKRLVTDALQDKDRIQQWVKGQQQKIQKYLEQNAQKLATTSQQRAIHKKIGQNGYSGDHLTEQQHKKYGTMLQRLKQIKKEGLRIIKEDVDQKIRTNKDFILNAKSTISRLRNKGKNRHLETLSDLMNDLSRIQKQTP